MSRRAQSLPPAYLEKPPRSRCTTAICFSWKVLTCVVSHVTLVSLVVAYCIAGALLFEHLEAENEKIVKRGIAGMRSNVTEDLWQMTSKIDYLYEENWTSIVEKRLEDFEMEILTAMKTKGWDGNENENQNQWTFFGALFYSIIVITTIGYGHIAPKTDMGKVTTIFYAILGIPLMLLCLSNIGDIMASSFRFLYWRVCCFVCTREPKRSSSRRYRHGGRTSIRQSQRFSNNRSQQPSSIRRSIRASQRSTDSGCITNFEPSGMIHSYSDPELRLNTLNEENYQNQRFNITNRRNDRDIDYSNRNNQRLQTRDRINYNDRHTIERERSICRGQLNNKYNSINDIKIPQIQTNRIGSGYIDTTNKITSYNNRNKLQQRSPHYIRAKSADPRYIQQNQFDNDLNYSKMPILCNRYALANLDNNLLYTNVEHGKRSNDLRSQSMPRHIQRQHKYHHSQQQRYGNRLEIPEIPVIISRPISAKNYDYEYDDDIEMVSVRKDRRSHQQIASHIRRERAVPLPPSPRIMSPMGFAVHRQARLTLADDDSLYDDDWDSYGEISPRSRPVPIWLCVFLVISYIIAGAFLFSEWEHWSFLDSAYFCFITLTTIGFGDFVPAQGVKENSEVSIALCSLYLLFGISLLAMSFNLVQEEVIANVKNVARRLGILKEQEIDE